jgi:hypothetical protein
MSERMSMKKLEEIKLSPVEKFVILNASKGSSFESSKRLYFYYKERLGEELDRKIDNEFEKYLESVRIKEVDVDDLVRKALYYLNSLGIRYSESVARERVNEFLRMKIIRITKESTMLDFAIVKILSDEGKLKKVKRGLYIWN